MNMNEWIASPEFLAIWKEAFRDAKKKFKHLSEKVTAQSKREKAKSPKIGSLWTLIQKPYPGIHLLAIELPADISPLTIRLRVWIDQDNQHLYEKLVSVNSPEILSQRTVLSAGQRPRSSWESQLRAASISLIGLSYTVSNISFVYDATTAAAELQRMGDEFFAWLIANLQADGLSPQINQPTPPTIDNLESVENPEITYPDELHENGAYPEGAVKTVAINAYERNAESRQKCIEHYGPKCAVCAIDFERRYGDIGRGFIHVHHVVPLSLIKQVYLVDPIRDLKPVCPNCHAMLHRVSPPLSIDELRGRIKPIEPGAPADTRLNSLVG